MHDIDWNALLTFSMSPLELFIRGTVMYLFLFFIFRFVLHRDVGAVGIADLLVLVIIADAAQNAMSSGYESIPDGIILVSTIAGWNYLFDFLSFHSIRFRRVADPGPICLVKNGTKLKRNMRREFITDDELMAALRDHGVDSLDEVKGAYLESDGQISVIRVRR